MERVTDFSYSQMIKRLSAIVNSVRAFGITKPNPKISFTLKTDRWIDNPDYIEVNKPSELFPEIQQAVLNAPAPKGLLRPAVIIVLKRMCMGNAAFPYTEMNKFIRQEC